MHLLLLGLDRGQRRARAAVLGVVAGQHGDIGARLGDAYLVAGALHRAEVTHYNNLFPFVVDAAEGDDALLVVVAGNPLEALPVHIVVPQGRVVQVVMVQVPDIGPQLGVLIVIQQQPVQPLLLVPLNELAELAAHEQQLLARVGHHVTIESPQVLELVRIVAGHFVYQGTLAMHHLIVGQGEHKILRKSIGQREGQVVVLALAEQRVGGHVVHHVVHPAHIPFKVEAQPAVIPRLGHHGERGGLLGAHDGGGVKGEGGGIHVPQELDSLQIDVSPILVGPPLAAPAAIVQVEHGGHRIHPDAVDMELIQPVHHIGDQEGAHLIPAVVEDAGTPIGVLPAQGVGGLVAVAAVELKQAALVSWEVGAHPVDDDADARPMAHIHKTHEIVGSAVPGGGGIIPGDLIAPGGVVGVLADGKQLHVGIPHVLQVGNELIRAVHIGQEISIPMPPPGAQVHLIDVHRTAQHILAAPGAAVGPVGPLKTVQVEHLAGVVRPGGGMGGIRVSLEHEGSVRLLNVVFVLVIGLRTGDEPLPDGGGNALHGRGFLVPVIKAAQYPHALGVGRPHSENIALPAVHRLPVAA